MNGRSRGRHHGVAVQPSRQRRAYSNLPWAGSTVAACTSSHACATHDHVYPMHGVPLVGNCDPGWGDPGWGDLARVPELRTQFFTPSLAAHTPYHTIDQSLGLVALHRKDSRESAQVARG